MWNNRKEKGAKSRAPERRDRASGFLHCAACQFSKRASKWQILLEALLSGSGYCGASVSDMSLSVPRPGWTDRCGTVRLPHHLALTELFSLHRISASANGYTIRELHADQPSFQIESLPSKLISCCLTVDTLFNNWLCRHPRPPSQPPGLGSRKASRHCRMRLNPRVPVPAPSLSPTQTLWIAQSLGRGGGHLQRPS